MKNTKTSLAAAIAIGALSLAGCSATTPATPSGAPPAGAPTGTATPSVVLPVAVDPITNTATAPGLTVSNVLLEDNTDPSGKAIGDRLQFTIGNDTANPLSGIEVFYTMTDATTGAAESYYQALDEFIVPAKASATVYFDNSGESGHFPENPFSVYRSSTNQVDFVVEVSAPGLKIATATGAKSAGTGETGD